jgi:cation:H+ antiporter
MLTTYVALIAGLVLAAIGGELFVRGVVALSRWLQIPAGIAAATMAAFATSAPELSVSTLAAAGGTPEIGLGDALGSNVVNIALVLGLTLLVSNTHVARDVVKREVAFAVAAPLLTGVLAADGLLSRLDAVVLLGVFGGWLAVTMKAAREHRTRITSRAEGERHSRSVGAGVAGLVLLFAAGYLIVRASQNLVLAWGIDGFLIGATLIAVGTSMPELATALVAKLRGYDEVGMGTVLGSNLFNGLFIVPLAALIHPVTLRLADVLIALTYGTLLLLVLVPGTGGYAGRWRGGLLIAAYGSYMTLLLRD